MKLTLLIYDMALASKILFQQERREKDFFNVVAM